MDLLTAETKGTLINVTAETKPRIKSLDSLRGLAALTVVIAHALAYLIKGHSFDEYTPLYIFRAAHEAVIFFFLLSGFVLAFQAMKQGYFNYGQFLIQRFCRIYIPYVIVILLLFSWYSQRYSAGDLHDAPLTPNFLSTQSLIDHLFLVGNFNTNLYNPVMWSLVHEMRISILFPLILVLIAKGWKFSIIIGVTVSLVAGILIAFDINNSNGFNNSYLHTAHYFLMFLIGALIAKYNEALSGYYRSLSRNTKIKIIVIAVLVYVYSRMIYLIPHKFSFLQLSTFLEIIADWLVTAAAGIFLIAASNLSGKRNWLLHPINLTLGKISYSLYLIHVPIIFVCTHLLTNLSLPFVILNSVVSAIGLSLLYNKYVEKTSALLGKSISKLF